MMTVEAGHQTTDRYEPAVFVWPKDAAQIPASRIRTIALHERCSIVDEHILSDMITKLRVNQLVTTLRAQPLDEESSVMLGVLESLVVAGEISLADFIQRVQNLFPQIFDTIDARLRDNLMRMLVD